MPPSLRSLRSKKVKFGEAKQKIVTFLATTLKAFYAVSAALIGFSGGEPYNGDVKDPFSSFPCVFFPCSLYVCDDLFYAHTYSPSKNKKVRSEGTHRKNAFPPFVVTQTTLSNEGMSKRRKHFLPKYFPFVVKSVFSLRDGYILPHVRLFVKKA